MYQIVNEGIVRRLSDNALIPIAPGNMDYMEYARWLDDGGSPQPADPTPDAPPTLEEKVDALLKGGQALEDIKAQVAAVEEASETKEEKK